MEEEHSWDLDEVIVASTANTVAVIHTKTGKTLKTYHVKNIAPKCLALLGEDYFIGAPSNIPDIKMWPVHNEKTSTQVNSPCGLVNVLTVSNCATYCLAAFKQEIRIWNVKSGEMLTSFTRHYQDITALKFTSDDAFFISGSKDGCVCAWIFSKMTSITTDDPNRVKPLYSWNDHTKEITDIFVGSNGVYSRMATSSADMTSKIYELDTGLLITTVCLDVPVTSVVMDPLEYYLLLGTLKGTICKINLYYEQPRELHHNTMEKDEVTAHENAIISLSMSFVGDKVASIASDCILKIWDVASLTCILRVQSQEGPHHNAIFIPYPAPLLTKEEPCFLVAQLERTLVSSRERYKKNGTVLFKTNGLKPSLISAGNYDDNYHHAILNGQSHVLLSEVAAVDAKAENKFQEIFRGETMGEIIDINAQMYSYMLSTVFKSIDTAAQQQAAQEPMEKEKIVAVNQLPH